MKLGKRTKSFIGFLLIINLTIHPLIVQAHQIISQDYTKKIQEKASVKNFFKSIIAKSGSIQEEHVKEIYECCKAAHQHVAITPDKLAGLNFRAIVHIVIECAYETNTLHELPQGLINCAEHLERGSATVHSDDLIEALPVIIEKMMDPIMPSIISRAPRLDAPGSVDGSIVGPLLTCDFSEVIRILNNLLAILNQCCADQRACCALLVADFAGTFTALANLTLDFNGTFTTLIDINNSLTACCENIAVNFDGTFTSLTDIKNIIVEDFNGTFTTLTDIQDTVTACCENIAINFNGTFTAIAAINTEANSTFTVLTDIKNTITTCCNALTNELNGTFTAIATINNESNSTFTALTDIKDTLTTCCAQITNEFNGTFTVLANLSTTTVTCDLSSVFTVLNTIENDVNGTFTVLANLGTTTLAVTCDLSSVFTVLNTINNEILATFTALNACCTNITNEFNATFTAIAAINTEANSTFTAIADLKNIVVTDFAGTFTALDACCTNITNDFNGTFTALAHLGSSTAIVDFSPVFTVLNTINNEILATFTALNACCTNITNEFNATFTAIAAISTQANSTFTALTNIQNTLNTDFGGTFTALNACCTNITNEFNATFTAIANIQNTINTDFNGTFTVLNRVILDNSGTFTALNACCNQTFVDFSGVFTSLTDIRSTITIDFNGTFTVLNAIQSLLGTASSTPMAEVTYVNEQVSGPRLDDINIQFQYGVSTFDVNTTVVATGTVVPSLGMAQLSTGAATNGAAIMQSIRAIRYLPGHQAYATFSAMYQTGGVANSTQWVGNFDSINGAAVGFNGTTFSLLYRNNSVDTVIPQSSFNVDKLDGTGPSGFVIVPTNINTFQIVYGDSAGSFIEYQILGTNDQLFTFHRITQTNTTQTSLFTNSFLPIQAQVIKTAGTTNIVLTTASWSGGTVSNEYSKNQASRFFAANSTNNITVPATGETFILTVTNSTTFQGVLNRLNIRIASLSGGQSNTASVSGILRLRKNATVTGTSFTSVDPANSVAQFSTTGTYTAGTGTVIFVAYNNTFGSGPYTGIFDPSNSSFVIRPGESFTITFESLSGAGTTAVGAAGWEERF